MAAETIMYDLDVLRSKESQLQSISRDLEDITVTMHKLNNMVDDYWSGSASDTFKNQNSKTVSKIKELRGHVEAAKGNLTEAIGKYSSNEETNKGVVDDLSTDNIF